MKTLLGQTTQKYACTVVPYCPSTVFFCQGLCTFSPQPHLLLHVWEAFLWLLMICIFKFKNSTSTVYVQNYLLNLCACMCVCVWEREREREREREYLFRWSFVKTFLASQTWVWLTLVVFLHLPLLFAFQLHVLLRRRDIWSRRCHEEESCRLMRLCPASVRSAFISSDPLIPIPA